MNSIIVCKSFILIANKDEKFTLGSSHFLNLHYLFCFYVLFILYHFAFFFYLSFCFSFSLPTCSLIFFLALVQFVSLSLLIREYSFVLFLHFVFIPNLFIHANMLITSLILLFIRVLSALSTSLYLCLIVSSLSQCYLFMFMSVFSWLAPPFD